MQLRAYVYLLFDWCVCACIENHSYTKKCLKHPQAVRRRLQLFTKLFQMETAGIKLATLQHCKSFHNLCGTHFIESLNAHGGRGVSGKGF